MWIKLIAGSALVGLVALCGCGPSQGDANQAIREFCAEHGGVASLHYYRPELPGEASYSGECKDGSRVD